MTTNPQETDLDQRIRIVLNECSEAVAFADRVAAASHSEQVAVGTDHLRMLDQAVRRAAAAYTALVERDAEVGLRSVVEPLPPQEVRDLEAVVRGLTTALGEAGERSALTIQALEAALAESRTALAESRDRGAVVADEHTVTAVGEAVSNGGWWKSCTGCHETNEGQETGGYPFSKLFQCYVGAGCTECGGIGVVWEYYTAEEFAAMAREMRGEDPAADRPSDDVNDLGNNPAMQASMDAVAEAHDADDLDHRLKERGMFTVGEMMGTTPLTKWKTHTGVQDLESFARWLDAQVRQFLTMQAEYHLGGSKGREDELYEWVLAHSAALQSVRINFTAALARSAVSLVALVDELDHAAEFERLLTLHDGRRVAALARQLVAHLRETYPLPPRKED